MSIEKDRKWHSSLILRIYVSLLSEDSSVGITRYGCAGICGRTGLYIYGVVCVCRCRCNVSAFTIRIHNHFYLFDGDSYLYDHRHRHRYHRLPPLVRIHHQQPWCWCIPLLVLSWWDLASKRRLHSSTVLDTLDSSGNAWTNAQCNLCGSVFCTCNIVPTPRSLSTAWPRSR